MMIKRIGTSDLFDLRDRMWKLIERAKSTSQSDVREAIQSMLEPLDKAASSLALTEAHEAWKNRVEETPRG